MPIIIVSICVYFVLKNLNKHDELLFYELLYEGLITQVSAICSFKLIRCGWVVFLSLYFFTPLLDAEQMDLWLFQLKTLVNNFQDLWEVVSFNLIIRLKLQSRNENERLFRHFLNLGFDLNEQVIHPWYIMYQTKKKYINNITFSPTLSLVDW